MAQSRWLSSGLFCTTLATLVLEILDSRLLSVMTWYHLSFLAVSLAMLGMAAGAVLVFLAGPRYRGSQAPATLGTWATVFALLLPLSHLINLIIPLPTILGLDAMPIVALVISTIVLALPFFASGVVVTLVLTRVGGSIGRLYAWDLIGAATGCAAVVALLNVLSLSSVAMVAGGVAALGAWCFQRAAGARRSWVALGLTVLLGAAAAINGDGAGGISIRYAKNHSLPPADQIARAAWNSHSFVMVDKARAAPYFYWGPGLRARTDNVQQAFMVIDGEAATSVAQWDGDVRNLEWVKHDVTAAPYALRGGDVAIIGVGGGRDILSALASGNTHVTGIEINRILLDTLTVTYRDFAGIAGHAGVTLVHDEARSVLSRSPASYDLIQMSLIDTWAATGAGAFTLTENGLYTTDGWRVFLDALKPGGVFSVSRWFSAGRLSETTRLLALGVAAVIDRGGDPRRQLVLLSRNSVATLITSNQPLTDADRDRLLPLARDEGFSVLASPWTDPAAPKFGTAVASRTRAELDAAVADPDLDYTPPSDDRPYFFNLLRVRSFTQIGQLARSELTYGNLAATTTLVLLFIISAVLVTAVVIGPLAAAGAPAREIPHFGAALAYFALIGTGYMLIQIPYLQRFSVFLGHPVYTFAVILLSMILFTGLGSYLSDRIPLGPRGAVRVLPIAISAAVVVEALLLPVAVRAAISWQIAGRTVVVLLFTAPLSLMLGCCFPIGMRLVGRLSDVGAAWMWGVNGACSVLASVAAVAVSMWLGISVNLAIAAACYLALARPMHVLMRAAGDEHV